MTARHEQTKQHRTKSGAKLHHKSKTPHIRHFSNQKTFLLSTGRTAVASQSPRAYLDSLHPSDTEQYSLSTMSNSNNTFRNQTQNKRNCETINNCTCLTLKKKTMVQCEVLKRAHTYYPAVEGSAHRHSWNVQIYWSDKVSKYTRRQVNKLFMMAAYLLCCQKEMFINHCHADRRSQALRKQPLASFIKHFRPTTPRLHHDGHCRPPAG